MEDRRDFLKSKFDSTNKFNLSIPIKQNHIHIFQSLADTFKPACKLTNDIKALVTREDLNVCTDKNILIFYQGDALKLNSLKFYLVLNFLSNWKPYSEYISNIVNVESITKLKIDSASMAEIAELRFKDTEDTKKRLGSIYNTDILFLTLSHGNRLFDSDFFAELYRTIIGLRSNQGLITIIIYTGSESQYKLKNYDSYFVDLYIKKFSLGHTTSTKKSNKSTAVIQQTTNTIDDQEVFS